MSGPSCQMIDLRQVPTRYEKRYQYYFLVVVVVVVRGELLHPSVIIVLYAVCG